MQKLLFAAALSGLVFAARAQVNVDVVFDQEQYLRGDSVSLRLRIANFSGQTLQLGTTPDWLGITITDEGGKAIKQKGRLPAFKPFTIDSAKTVALPIELAPYFDLSVAGQYGLTANIKIPQIDQDVTMPAKKFDVVSGAKVYEKEVGMPGTSPLVVRKYALQQATFFKETRLYARVTDVSEATVFRVIPLGVLPSVSRPEAYADNSSQLHVLFQTGQRSFSYSIVTPDGDQIIRQTHDIVGSSRPRLQQEKDGRIVVKGGARRISLTDLPPPPQMAQTNTSAEIK